MFSLRTAERTSTGTSVGPRGRSIPQGGPQADPTIPSARPRKYRARSARVPRAPLVLLPLLLFGFLYITTTEEYTATARVGFVEEVFFDYADAERIRLEGRVISEIATLRDDGDVRVEILRPPIEQFMDVQVTAPSASQAAAEANRLASLLIERDVDALSERRESQLAALESQRAQLASQVDEFDQQLANWAVQEAEAEANRFSGDAATLESLTVQLRQAQSRQSIARVQRDTFAGRIAQLDLEITEAQSDLVDLAANSTVTRGATVPAEPDPIVRGGALLAATLIAVAAIGLVRQANRAHR